MSSALMWCNNALETEKESEWGIWFDGSEKNWMISYIATSGVFFFFKQFTLNLSLFFYLWHHHFTSLCVPLCLLLLLLLVWPILAKNEYKYIYYYIRIIWFSRSFLSLFSQPFLKKYQVCSFIRKALLWWVLWCTKSFVNIVAELLLSISLFLYCYKEKSQKWQFAFDTLDIYSSQVQSYIRKQWLMRV